MIFIHKMMHGEEQVFAMIMYVITHSSKISLINVSHNLGVNVMIMFPQSQGLHEIMTCQ